MSRKMTAALLAALTLAAIHYAPVAAQQTKNEEFVRRARSKVQPTYPDLARKMNIVGTVKVAVVVSPSGVVKDAKVVGGHPVLAQSALDAARKWRFEPAQVESSGIIDFKFDPR